MGSGHPSGPPSMTEDEVDRDFWNLVRKPILFTIVNIRNSQPSKQYLETFFFLLLPDERRLIGFGSCRRGQTFAIRNEEITSATG
jgi:hypothetical protein